MDIQDLNGTKIVQDGLVVMVAEFMQTFDTMWGEMGISASVHKSRLDVILQYVRSLFVDMINDEKEFMLELKSSIETYERELLDLAKELGEVPYQVLQSHFIVVYLWYTIIGTTKTFKPSFYFSA